jgi:hypothetical protein
LVVWLQYARLGISLFAVIKAAIVFNGTLPLSWFVVVAVQSIPVRRAAHRRYAAACRCHSLMDTLVAAKISL